MTNTNAPAEDTQTFENTSNINKIIAKAMLKKIGLHVLVCGSVLVAAKMLEKKFDNEQ
jgi:hypothetical protein